MEKKIRPQERRYASEDREMIHAQASLNDEWPCGRLARKSVHQRSSISMALGKALDEVKETIRRDSSTISAELTEEEARR